MEHNVEHMMPECSSWSSAEDYAHLPKSEQANIVLALVAAASFWFLRTRFPRTSPKLSLLRVLLNFSILSATFLVSFMARYYYASPPVFWPQSFDWIEAWHTFDTMYDVSQHQSEYLVNLSHSVGICILLRIFTARNLRALCRALAIASLSLVFSFSSHAWMSPSSGLEYCVRNRFLKQWDQQSGLHILTHVVTEIPMNAYKLFVG